MFKWHNKNIIKLECRFFIGEVFDYKKVGSERHGVTDSDRSSTVKLYDHKVILGWP